MEKVQDPAFGLMEYDVAWEKEDTLKIWGKTFEIRITANDLEEEGINEIQRETYLSIKDTIPKIIKDNFPAIVEFCIENFDLDDVTSSDISLSLQPTTVLFQEDGSWGILMECDYDHENGIALYFEDGNTEVGTQDMFL